jgi:para-aminobenzoate synthetase component I
LQKSTQTFTITNAAAFKIQMLNWANQFNIFCFLDNHHYQHTQPNFNAILAAGAQSQLTLTEADSLNKLNQLQNGQWQFGFISYDVKNKIEATTSNNFDGINVPLAHFFTPSYLIELAANTVIITADNPEQVFAQISTTAKTVLPTTQVSLTPRQTQQQYINNVQTVLNHIKNGNCYVLNYCQEFFNSNAQIEPIATYLALSQLSPMPFAALYKYSSTYCLSASPERYLKKAGGQLLSQPIKGTTKRGAIAAEDAALKNALANNPKEQAENVMVVDLVRNDLSKICQQGTVKVSELFGMYTFAQVHQMISTITGQLKPNVSFADIIAATFPMGSMTGAPKKRVMQIAEALETTKRGLYSGAIGYINPNGNFDFNVVIRSILYNAATKYVSLQTGSAITANSIAQQEYEECLLKAQAIMQVLQKSSQ